MKRCPKCEEEKPLTEFYTSKGKGGCKAYCKPCWRVMMRTYRASRPDYFREYRRTYREDLQNRKHILLREARYRAAKKGVPFDLTEDDFEMPEFCPILGTELILTAGTNRRTSPSLDRIYPALGYVPGNIQVISDRANTMKNDATVDELRRFAAWVLKTFPEES